MAHKKAGSTANTNRDSISKRLGIKRYEGESVGVGEILIRQKGSKYGAGSGTKLANDYTIFALSSGKVNFKKRLGKTMVEII